MRPFVLASTLLAAAIAPSAAAGLSVWVGPATGNWSLASNWSAGVPNDLALIDDPPRAPFAVTQNINASLSTLTIGAGDSLTSLDNIDTTLTGLVNNGTWFVNSVGNPNDLAMNAPVVTFSGNGSLQFSNNSQNRIFGVSALRKLVNGVGHTIRGAGSIGFNFNLDVVNDGVIRADQSAALTIDASNTCTNNGLLAASGGGTLVLLNTGFANTSGIIRAEADSVISLQGASIVSGELETQGNGVINLTTNLSSFSAVHLVGTLTQPDDADVLLNSSITNDAVWAQNSVGSFTDI
ncbi:MAG: hypothetical protein SGJ09_01070 [Phycisphaerae bacterium]|nr:hypothetical protein [Phycisphaerae bacterium]